MLFVQIRAFFMYDSENKNLFEILQVLLQRGSNWQILAQQVLKI